MIYRQLFLLCAVFFFWQQLWGQQQDSVILSVDYQFVHIADTNHRDQPVVAEMVLHIGDSLTQYSNAIIENEWRSYQSKLKNTQGGSGTPVLFFMGAPSITVRPRTMSSERIYRLSRQHRLIRAALVGSEFFSVEMTEPNIPWVIENETKMISGQQCQKASCHFKGRSYTAWFAPQLPFPYGPWKLCALPGLILEATDSKNEVIFTCKGIKREPGQSIRIPAQRISITEKEFNKAQNAFNSDPVGMAQAQLPAGSPPITVQFKDAKGNSISGAKALEMIKAQSELKENNPVELTIQ
jgi:GLPGLI family protein